MPRNDVTILGCGVAGSTCALKLLKEGFDVTLIEKNPEVGGHTNTKIDITENISLQHIIKELDLTFLDKSNKSVWISRNNTFVFESEVSDLFVKRGSEKNSFDVRMGNKIRDLGGEIKTGASLKKIKKREDKVDSIKIKSEDGTKELQTDFLVDATGANSKALREMDIRRFKKTGREINGYGLVSENLKIESGETKVFIDSKLAPGGYFYLAKARNGLGVACLVLPGRHISSSLENHFNNFVNKKQELHEVIKSSDSLNYFYGSRKSGILRSVAKGNFCAVGDSAYLIEPLFGYGVRPAILSGYLAGKNIKKTTEVGSQNLKNYEREVYDSIVAKQSKMYFLRKVFEELNNKDLDTIIGSLKKLEKEKGLDNLLGSGLKKQLPSFLKLFIDSPLSTGKMGYKTIKSLFKS